MMNRPKPTTIRRPCAAKPSGHPPPGDFIALGSKSGGESKAPAVLLKPASTLPTDRKRETSSSLPSSSGLSGLVKRPKISSTPPVSALGRLADVAAVDKRAISPSIKEPSVVPIEVPPAVLLDEIENAEQDGNDDRIEGVLCGAVKQLKMNRAKPDITLYLSLMFLAKIKPNLFATEGIIEALCSLLRRDASINFKAKGNSLVSVLACNLLMSAYEEDENWPEIFVKVYIEDSLGERIWVDSSHCKNFVDNIQTAFSTKMPPKSMLLQLQTDTGRSGGDISAGSSPHPSTPDEDDSQTELLIAEEKLSPEDDGQVMPRYEELSESVEDYILDVLKDQLNRRQPMDNVSRNLLRLLTATCGYKEVRLMAVQRLEMWLQNPKLTRPAQDLLMSLCMNCNSHGADDMEVISNLIKIRLKPKVILNHYMLCVRELLNAHKDNLGTMVKLVIFNELSNARNPNNMQVLHTLLQHSPEQAPKPGPSGSRASAWPVRLPRLSLARRAPAPQPGSSGFRTSAWLVRLPHLSLARQAPADQPGSSGSRASACSTGSRASAEVTGPLLVNVLMMEPRIREGVWSGHGPHFTTVFLCLIVRLHGLLNTATPPPTSDTGTLEMGPEWDGDSGSAGQAGDSGSSGVKAILAMPG
ncbi:integrator complex subunit 1-like [Oncorhynchus nerka]|uniref:integrator complex subunit 1-like n=1 Tax=Oncorhynchus nerka TaxID=8023 RepID=UPI0031B87F47